MSLVGALSDCFVKIGSFFYQSDASVNPYDITYSYDRDDVVEWNRQFHAYCNERDICPLCANSLRSEHQFSCRGCKCGICARVYTCQDCNQDTRHFAVHVCGVCTAQLCGKKISVDHEGRKIPFGGDYGRLKECNLSHAHTGVCKYVNLSPSGVPVSSDAPTDGQILVYNERSHRIEPDWYPPTPPPPIHSGPGTTSGGPG